MVLLVQLLHELADGRELLRGGLLLLEVPGEDDGDRMVVDLRSAFTFRQAQAAGGVLGPLVVETGLNDCAILANEVMVGDVPAFARGGVDDLAGRVASARVGSFDELDLFGIGDIGMVDDEISWLLARLWRLFRADAVPYSKGSSPSTAWRDSSSKEKW